MSAAALFFWAVAALQVILSTSVHLRAVRAPSIGNVALARSQRKDGWFGCAIMTLTLICDRYPFTGWIYVHVQELTTSALGDVSGLAAWIYLIGTITMAWLVHRTLERRRLLQVK